MPHAIRPVILCGGSGARLWPVSRARHPKQFAAIMGERSLFQHCAERLSGPPFAAPVVVTGSAFRFVALEQLAGAGVSEAEVLLEPAPRDTAAAVLAAALHVAAADPDAVMLVAPSDHLIADPEALRRAVAAGMEAVGRGDLVTFGVPPDRPETGYGYLVTDSPEGGEGGPAGGARRVTRFVEKPDSEAARALIANDGALWNSGMFLGRAADFIAAFEAHAPDLMAPVRAAVEAAAPDLGFIRLDAEAWNAVRSISIDRAVMERAGNLSVAPLRCAWTDLGDWDAVWRESAKSADGVAASDAAHAIDCSDSLLRAEGEDIELIGIGLEDMLVVAMPDAVLVAPKSRSQDVRAAVELLKAHGRPQATEFRRDLRPWGWFETVARGARHQVKRIVVRPGAALSLQSHAHRAEHWVVVSGTALVTIGSVVRRVPENESVFVPKGAIHRLQNPGTGNLEVIEVQTGEYLGEDDIRRHEDVYARTSGE